MSTMEADKNDDFKGKRENVSIHKIALALLNCS
jgi:hypothetical protein